MKNKIKESFSDLELDCNQIISKELFPILILYSIADQVRMKQYYSKNPEHRLNNLKLTENQIIAECRSCCTNILTGTEFNIIFSNNDVKNFSNVTAILEYVSVNYNYEVDNVNNGYTPLCIINFPQGKPEIINKLAPETGRLDSGKYDNLFLTQKQVMEKILNEFDKREE